MPRDQGRDAFPPSPIEGGNVDAAVIYEVRVRGDGRTRTRRPRLSHALWFAGPAILVVGIFFVLPFVANAIFAFTNWSGYSTQIKFNGLTNFQLLQKLGILGHAIAITVVYAIVAMTVQNVVGLGLAIALQNTNRVNTVFRGLFFIPVLISPLAAGYIWAAALTAEGPINAMISAVVPGEFNYYWLGAPVTALLAVASIDAWKWCGLATLVYIAGLNSIPRPLVESSMLDGAGPLRRFWKIKFPLLAPAFTFNIVITLVGAFSAFDVVFSTTRGGPGDATTLLNVGVYLQYGQGFLGSASALSLVVTILVIVTAVPLIGYLRRREIH